MSSGSTCAVVGCHNNSRKLKTFNDGVCFEHQKPRKHCVCPAPYSIHTIPRDEERRRAWLAALKLKHPPKRIYVCSFHFVDKRPTELHPDPELYLGYHRSPPKKRRRLVRDHQSETPVGQPPGPPAPHDDFDGMPDNFSPSQETSTASSAHPSDPQMRTVSTQWVDPTQQDHNYCRMASRSNVQDQMTQCDEIAYFLLQNDADSFLYTGISLEAFNLLVSSVEQCVTNSFTMNMRDQVLLTLMKLKTNRVVRDLSKQFHVSASLASKIIAFWIDKLEEVLRPLIPWLPKDTIRATMPDVFKVSFPNTTCVVDCSESLLQKPKNLDSRGESYSHYYSHNTVKYLVAVAPSGLTMFISPAYGGRCSDKFITMDSGFLDYLMPGDEVMADRGFTIKDLLFERKVKLVMPSFTKRGGQLTEEQVTSTRRIAHVRIHVERAIRRLKVYKILSQVVPISMTPKIDKILRICAALANLRDDLIRD